MYSTITSKYILGKIKRDFGVNDSSFIGDAVEWIGEALEDIGSLPSLRKCHKELIVKNFRTKVPSNPQGLLAVVYNNHRLTHKNPDFIPSCEENDYTDFIPQCSFGNDWYTTDLGYIHTSFQQGKIKVYYLTIPVDEKNYPLIIDKSYHKEAVSWYIIYKLHLSGQIKPKQDMNWQIAKNMFEDYAQRARNEVRFDSVDKLELVRSIFTNFIPDVTLAENMFLNL